MFQYIFPALSLCLGTATFILGFKAYNKFLAKHLVQKQLDVVLELLKEIHNCKNRYTEFCSGTSHSPITLIAPESIFQLAVRFKNNGERKLYFLDKAEPPNFIVDEPSLLNWSFYNSFILNPLLPKRIAEKLSQFNLLDGFQYVEKDKLQFKGAIVLGNREWERMDMIYTLNTPIFNSSYAFVEAVNGLKDTIATWLEKYGIENINLPII